MLRNRSDTLFHLLDVNLLVKIYDLSTPVLEVDGCPLSRVPCVGSHIYHICCFEKWLNKRPNCPLDNTPISKETYDPCDSLVAFGPSPYKMLLHNVYQSEIPFVRKRLNDERKAVSESWIVRHVKHSPWAISSDEIKKNYNKFFSREENRVSDAVIDELILNLINRGYLSKVTEESSVKYKYIA